MFNHSWKYCISLLLCVLFCSVGFAQKDKEKERQLQQQQDYQLANEYLSSEKTEEGIKIMEELIEDEFNDNFYQILLKAYASIGETKKQEKLIKKAIKKSDERFNYVIDLGSFYLSVNEPTKAEKQFDKVLSNLSANNSEIQATAAYFSNIKQYDYSIKTYQKGRQLLKSKTAYTYELSYIYQILDKNEEIVNEYLVLLEENPLLLNQVEVNINNLFNRDKDNKLFKKLHETLLSKVKDNPKNQQLCRLYLWTLQKEGNYSLAFNQAKAIDKRFDNGNNSTMYSFASEAMNNKAYSIALKAYDYIIDKNNEDDVYHERSLISKMSCKYQEFKEKVSPTSKEIEALNNDYISTFKSLGMSSATAPLMQEYANVLAYDLHESQQAVDILDSLINMKSTSTKQRALAKIDRADIFLMEGDIWEASLTYSQVSKEMKNENEGSIAKYKNAMLSYYNGDFEWALSQFETLRASTSKLIANDAMEYSLLIKENMDEDSSYNALSYYSKADFMIFQNKYQEAEHNLDIIETAYLYHPIFDELIYKKGEIAYKQKDYQKADSLFKTVLMKYPEEIVADDAVWALAQMYENVFKQDAQALEYYQKIILDYPSSLYVSQARKKNEELSAKISK